MWGQSPPPKKGFTNFKCPVKLHLSQTSLTSSEVFHSNLVLSVGISNKNLATVLSICTNLMHLASNLLVTLADKHVEKKFIGAGLESGTSTFFGYFLTQIYPYFTIFARF